MSRNRSEHWDTMVDILDGCFPKGNCGERGSAMVMLSYIDMMLTGTPFDERGNPIGKEPTNDQVWEFLDHSNRIEGIHDNKSIVQALEAWNFLLDQEELTEGVILKTHKILMLDQPLQPNERGYFRRVPVYIGGREGIKHTLIEHAIRQWIVNMNDLLHNGKNENPIFLERITREKHVEYETIHPFVDGNGRTGRMFMNWQRVKVGLPIIIIHEGKEQSEYSKWFK